MTPLTSGTSPLVLVAMGGHAFLGEGERGTIQEQRARADQVGECLMALVEREYQIVITHGNGPQVGDLLLQQELAAGEVPAMPLDVLVAMTEGSLGHILQQALLNRLQAREIRRWVVTMVTQVEVDESDPAFQRPEKPVGPPVSAETAERRRNELHWDMREVGEGKWRRHVASPIPQKVLQFRMVRDAALDGHIVIAGGGGGVPVCRTGEGRFRGVEAVVDKDRTSAVLATDIGASLLIILTAVPCVYIDFGTPDEKALGAVTLDEVERLMAEGHFPPGSMGPKVESVIHFLKRGGARALITDPASLPAALEGRAGTHFVGRI